MGKITETRKLYKDTINEVTKSEENWISFLDSASWNFKYDFTDQILIYAQRPDATACAEMEEWNKKVNRWVNKDADGIFVLSKKENSQYPFRLVFDVSDTHNYKGTKYNLWSMKPEYEQEVVETLESTFGAESEEKTLVQSIIMNAYNMVADNIQDYMSTIQKYKKETLLEKIPDDEMFNILVPTVWASVSYMMMTRCGINAKQEINIQEFSFIRNFDSDKIITILGNATSDIAEMGLREIAKTVINLQNEEKNKNRTFVKNQKQEYSNNKEIDKGGIKNEQENRIHESGRLQYTKSSDGTGEDTKWQIRKNEVTLSKNSQKGRIFNIIDGQEIEQRIDRNPRESDRNDTTNSRENGETRWDNRGIESTRSNEMDRIDEQLQINSRRTSSEGTNLHLEQNNPNFWRKQNDSNIVTFEDEETIDNILSNAPNVIKSKELLETYFKTNDSETSIQYIKNILGDAYTEYEIDNGQRVGYKTYDNGLYLWKGKYLQRTEECFKSWNDIKDYFVLNYLLKENAKNFIDLLTENEQEQNTTEAKNASVFSFTQENIDTVLKRGSGFENGKFRIYEQLTKGLTSKENIDFLKKEYGIGGFSEENIGWVDYDAKGIKLSKKIMSEKEEKQLLTWTQVEKRIRELISAERYLNGQEQDEYYDWLDANGIKTVNVKETVNDEDYQFAKRLHSYIKEYDIISYNANFPIENTEEDNIELLQADINDESNIKEYIDFLKASYEDLDYDDEITVEGKSLLVELEKRLPYYEFNNGDIVFIGTEEYEIRTINDERAVLVDISFPLITKEMPREEFDKKVKENPANDKLRTGKRKHDLEKTNKIIDKELPKEDKTFLEEMLEKCEVDDYRIIENDNELETVIINSSEYSPTETYKFILSRLDELDYPFWDENKNNLSNELYAARKKEKEYLIGKSVELENELYVIEDIQENENEEDFAVLQNQSNKTYRVETVGFIKYLLEAKQQEKELETEKAPQEEKLKANIKHKRRNKIEYFDLHPEVPMKDRNNFKIQNNDLGVGTKKEKYKNNIEAIKILKLCEEQNRYATKEEQEILSKYVGWGGLQEAFDSRIDEWNVEYKELKSLLTEKEYENASKSVLTAFYTPPIVIKSIYKALENMGLQRGNILEPSCRNR